MNFKEWQQARAEEEASRKANDVREAKQAKAEGMSRAERNAHEEWVVFMYNVIRETARRHKQYSVDEVIERYKLYDNAPTTHNWKALGPVMRRAAKDGIHELGELLPMVRSRRKSNHNHPLNVWVSLIYRK